MKKIYLAIMMVCALFTSCNMDLSPVGSLDDESGVQTYNDLRRLRNNLYNGLKAMNSGWYYTYPDIQCDHFMGLISNGNREGTISNKLFNSSDSDIESYWSAMYSRIASANFAIGKYEAAAEGAYDLTDDQKTEVARFLGETKFYRAYCYWMLVDKFCENYSKVGGSTAAKGLPLVTAYNPSGETSSYPGRSTQDETYALIEQDLADAYAALTAYEKSGVSNCKANLKPMAEYLSSWAVVAMQARVALLKGDNATAFAKAKQVIESGVYSLATLDNYAAMWTTDTSDEIIFRPYCSTTELPSSIGNYYLGTDQKSADYIPTLATLLSYGDTDIRFDCFFKQLSAEVSGERYGVYAFYKFGGNESLKTTSTPNFMHYPKVFRMSEMYLIAAEAGAENNTADASKYLNDFLKNRYTDYEEGTYSSSNIINRVREERGLEFIGEGMRLSDLRRWNQGFTRDLDYSLLNPSVNGVIVKLGAVTYDSNDNMYVWPIPSEEMTNNPQLKGQQNPGY